MRGAHVCMSGNLECSGVDPCDPCASATMTYVLVPAMKAAGIDQRNDPRVAHFLQTYAEAKRRLVAGLLAQVPPPAPVQAPIPSRPPVADLPLTEAELEAMASPLPANTVMAPSAVLIDPPMAGGPDEPGHSYDYALQDAQQATAPPPPPPPIPTPDPIPAGLMSDEDFMSKFPKAVAEELIEGYEPPPPPPPPVARRERTTDDGTYPNVEEEQAKLAERESASRLPPSDQPSIFKLAQDAITPKPKLPADQASDDGEVGSAPTEPAPLPAQPKASTDGVSAVAVNANNAADSTATKVEASSHG